MPLDAARPHLAGQAAREGAPLVLGRPARRQPGPHRSRWTPSASGACSRPSWQMGFKEIEVGFPRPPSPTSTSCASSSRRTSIPDDVTIQVLTQCRPGADRADRTSACRARRRAIVHFYNSTSILQRRVVFGLDKAGIVDIAVNAAKLCRKLEQTLGGTEIFYEYSPESYTGTEVEFAVEICEAVMDVIEPTPDRKIVLNLPATVEMYTPNLYADTIEWFLRHDLAPRPRRAVAPPAQRPGLRGGRGRARRAGGRRPRGRHPVRQRRAHGQRGRRSRWP